MVVKKIVFLGPAAAGKTTLRRFFFEGIPSDLLMKRQEPPSIGLKFATYDYLFMYPAEIRKTLREQVPFKLALVDTSGQEMEKWVTTQRREVFSGADIILFIFDVSEWADPVKKQFIFDYIWFVFKTRNEIAPSSLFFIIAHKYDKIARNRDNVIDVQRKITEDIKDYLFQKKELILDLTVAVTSLHKNYRNHTFSTLLNFMTNSLNDVMT
jgi:GTPase SAR1 family protein